MTDPTQTQAGEPQQPADGPAAPEPGQSTTPPTGEPQGGTQPVAEPEQQPEPDESGESGNREAARYRRQLRDTQADRDRLAGIVESYQRAEVETIAAEHMTAPTDLWATGQELDELLDDTGAVDPERVRATVADTIEARPHWARRQRPAPDPSQGSGANQGRRPGPTWQDAIQRSGR